MWQRFKFFAGLLIAGALFVSLWYGLLVYSEKYVKEVKDSPRIEDVLSVPPELNPGYGLVKSAGEGVGEGENAVDWTITGDNIPPDRDADIDGGKTDDGSASDGLPVDAGEGIGKSGEEADAAEGNAPAHIVPGSGKDDWESPAFKRGAGSVIFGRSPEEVKEKEAPQVKDAPPEPEPMDMASIMKRLNVEKSDPVFLRIIKADRLLELWMRPRDKESYVLVKKYPVLAVSGKLGPKQKQGDMQAPEGFYRAFFGSLNPNSNYHLSFNVGYPNAWDRMNDRTGNYIMVHGSNVSAGCFAMGDEGIEEIYALVEAFLRTESGAEGVPIHVYPFVPTSRSMTAVQRSRHYSFWRFMKDAWDWTESHKAPAPVRIAERAMVLEGSMLSLEGAAKRSVYHPAVVPKNIES